MADAALLSQSCRCFPARQVYLPPGSLCAAEPQQGAADAPRLLRPPADAPAHSGPPDRWEPAADVRPTLHRLARGISRACWQVDERHVTEVTDAMRHQRLLKASLDGRASLPGALLLDGIYHVATCWGVTAGFGLGCFVRIFEWLLARSALASHILAAVLAHYTREALDTLTPHAWQPHLASARARLAGPCATAAAEIDCAYAQLEWAGCLLRSLAVLAAAVPAALLGAMVGAALRAGALLMLSEQGPTLAAARGGLAHLLETERYEQCRAALLEQSGRALRRLEQGIELWLQRREPLASPHGRSRRPDRSQLAPPTYWLREANWLEDALHADWYVPAPARQAPAATGAAAEDLAQFAALSPAELYAAWRRVVQVTHARLETMRQSWSDSYLRAAEAGFGHSLRDAEYTLCTATGELGRRESWLWRQQYEGDLRPLQADEPSALPPSGVPTAFFQEGAAFWQQHRAQPVGAWLLNLPLPPGDLEARQRRREQEQKQSDWWRQSQAELLEPFDDTQPDRFFRKLAGQWRRILEAKPLFAGDGRADSGPL